MSGWQVPPMPATADVVGAGEAAAYQASAESAKLLLLFERRDTFN